MCDPGNPRPQCDARLGQPEASDQRFAMLWRELAVFAAQDLEPEICVTDRAADPDAVAALGATAPNLRSGGNLAKGGQRQHRRPRRGNRIATEQMHPKL